MSDVICKFPSDTVEMNSWRKQVRRVFIQERKTAYANKDPMLLQIHEL